MLRIAVLGSTKGTDLQAIIDNIENKKLSGVKLCFVLSNKEDALILKKAKAHNIKGIFLDPKDKTREEYDKELSKTLDNHKIGLILLIGYMKLMSKEFVLSWKNKVMNIHPSLLPMFAGGMDRNVHQSVLDYGCKVTGCSLIFIDEGADTGPIILQKPVIVDEKETVESLKAKVQEAEQEILIRGIELFRDNKIKVDGRIVRILK